MSADNNNYLFSAASQSTTLCIPTFEWPEKTKYHNSINNLRYPKPVEDGKSNIPSLTVIGNLVTKEFLECVELVTTMHKYKPRHFGKPFIEGLTQLEWAEVLKDLKYEFGHHDFPIVKQQVAVLFQNKMIGDYNALKAMIERTYYIYRPDFNPHQRGIEALRKYVVGSGRPFVYLNIAVNGESIGSLIVELYLDLVPLTCINFMRLCTKRNGGYSGTPVHRIVKDGWLQCGGYTLKSVKMPCENYVICHDRRGVLSMANNGRHCNNSTQFFINLQKADWMNSKYVGFGQVIFGDNTLRAIEQLSTIYEAPVDKVVIFRSGMLDFDQDVSLPNKVKSFTDGHIQNVSKLVGQIMQQLWKCVAPKLKVKPKVKVASVVDMYYPILPLEQDIKKTERFIYSSKPVVIQQEDVESELSESISEPISEIVEPIKSSVSESKDAEVQKFVEPKLYFHSLVNVVDRAENSLLEIELEPSQTMFTEIRKINDVSMYHLTMTPEEDVYFQMDSDDEKEAYAYVEKYGDKVSFSGPTIAKIARNIIETNNQGDAAVSLKQECYCKLRTSTSHRFVRESIICADEDMTETNLARFLRKQSIVESSSDTKDSKSASLKSPAQGFFYKKDGETTLTDERQRLSSSVLKKRITNIGQDHEKVFDSTKKRSSITVDAYKLKHVTTTVFPDFDSQSSLSTITCDKCLSIGDNSAKETDSSCELSAATSTTSFAKIRPGLHLKGDTPTYVRMEKSVE